MKLSRIILAVLSLFVFAACGGGGGDDSTYENGSFSGTVRVYNSEIGAEYVRDAVVVMISSKGSLYDIETTSTPDFNFTDVPPASYEFYAYKSGYEFAFCTYSVDKNDFRSEINEDGIVIWMNKL